jgi:hypothetical protein
MPALQLSAEHTTWLTRMENYLRAERYSRNGRERVSMARRFLCYLQKSGLNVHTVTPSDLRKYCGGLNVYAVPPAGRICLTGNVICIIRRSECC